jgi:hypothetical protein
MAERNMQSLDATVEETIELANQVIEQTRAEIARSQALSQAEGRWCINRSAASRPGWQSGKEAVC